MIKARSQKSRKRCPIPASNPTSAAAVEFF
jgi:hypothetical protein